MNYIRVDQNNKVLCNYTELGYQELSESEKQGLVTVETIPQAENIEGKASILYMNPTTKETWYEYVDVEPTTEKLLSDAIALLIENNIL